MCLSGVQGSLCWRHCHQREWDIDCGDSGIEYWGHHGTAEACAKSVILYV